MNSSRPLENGGGEFKSERLWAAVTAGLVYFALLLTAGLVLGTLSQLWLEPLVGPASAFALELTFLLPAAWFMNKGVARRFAIESPWPMGVVVAGTTFVLICAADLAFLALLDPIALKEVLNHGWAEARFVTQVLISALPLVCPRPMA